MQRAYMVVQCKLKNKQKMHFFYDFSLFLPLRQTASRPNDEIFTIFFQELGNLKNSGFLCQSFSIFLLHPHENQSKLLGYQGWVEILMITVVYSKSKCA